MTPINDYLSGRRLYGDDFSHEEIQKWYEDESEAYADLGAKDRNANSYVYHALNIEHGYSWLPNIRFPRVLGVGSAYGDELAPIQNKFDVVTILEPSDAFRSDAIFGKPVVYIKPAITGGMPLASGSQDLVTVFGALHHIPNVNYVVGEICRVLRAGGYLLLREPVVSTGDWRIPRKGLTKHERGIPIRIMREILAGHGFEVIQESLIEFSLSSRILSIFGRSVFSSRFLTKIDRILARLFQWSLRYHAISKWQKVRPTSCFCVARKFHGGEAR